MSKNIQADVGGNHHDDRGGNHNDDGCWRQSASGGDLASATQGARGAR